MTDYRITPARYAKGRMVIHCTPDGSGFKTRAMRLAEACGGKWVHRDHGYQCSKAQAERFEKLYAEGWDGNPFGKLLSPKGGL